MQKDVMRVAINKVVNVEKQEENVEKEGNVLLKKEKVEKELEKKSVHQENINQKIELN